MKKLELVQMEGLEGGKCNAQDTVINGIGGSMLIFGAATAAGPAGWLFLGISAGLYAYSIRNC